MFGNCKTEQSTWIHNKKTNDLLIASRLLANDSRVNEAKFNHRLPTWIGYHGWLHTFIAMYWQNMHWHWWHKGNWLLRKMSWSVKRTKKKNTQIENKKKQKLNACWHDDNGTISVRVLAGQKCSWLLHRVGPRMEFKLQQFEAMRFRSHSTHSRHPTRQHFQTTSRHAHIQYQILARV